MCRFLFPHCYVLVFDGGEVLYMQCTRCNKRKILIAHDCKPVIDQQWLCTGQFTKV